MTLKSDIQKIREAHNDLIKRQSEEFDKFMAEKELAVQEKQKELMEIEEKSLIESEKKIEELIDLVDKKYEKAQEKS